MVTGSNEFNLLINVMLIIVHRTDHPLLLTVLIYLVKLTKNKIVIVYITNKSIYSYFPNFIRDNLLITGIFACY